MMALLASTGFYTALGGVRSSSYIEFLQTLIMVLALALWSFRMALGGRKVLEGDVLEG